MKQVDVVVLGAGISGLMAAEHLIQEGVSSIKILDKGRSPGGRLATRRIEGGTFDHGAQFITARSDTFQGIIKQWLDKKWVSLWHHKHFPRYYVVGGMNQLAKKIAPLQHLACNYSVQQISCIEGGYSIVARNTEIDCLEHWFAKAVIVTCPIPQLFPILEKGEYVLDPQHQRLLQAVRYMPCLSILIRLSQDLKIEEGHLQEPFPGIISFVADNKQKSISALPSVTVQLNQLWSEAHYDEPDEQLWQYILPYLEQLHPDLQSILLKYQVKRWRFAQAYELFQAPCLNIGTTSPIIVCGDGFNSLEHVHVSSSRVENAVLSGISAGKHVVSYLKQK
jgi:predicted NAD/FAD-dependent oxidoreductase